MNENKELSLDMQVISVLDDYCGEKVEVYLSYIMRIFQRLKSLEKIAPSSLAEADIPDTYKIIMDFYNNLSTPQPKEICKNCGVEIKYHVQGVTNCDNSTPPSEGEEWIEELYNRFVADDVLDCIPEKNWEEMGGELTNFIRSIIQSDRQRAVREIEDKVKISKRGSSDFARGLELGLQTAQSIIQDEK